VGQQPAKAILGRLAGSRPRRASPAGRPSVPERERAPGHRGAPPADLRSPARAPAADV